MNPQRWFPGVVIALSVYLAVAIVSVAGPVVAAREMTVAAPQAALQARGGAAKPAASAPAQAGYAGEATCMTCHDQSYKGTKHALAFNERTPAATSPTSSRSGLPNDWPSANTPTTN